MIGHDQQGLERYRTQVHCSSMGWEVNRALNHTSLRPVVFMVVNKKHYLHVWGHAHLSVGVI